MHVTFLAYRVARDRLTTTEFYRQDIQILESLGFDVTIATNLREVPRRTDLIFLWWWNWLWLVGPVLKARGYPICVTGSLEPDIYEKKPWWYRFLVRNGLRFADRSVFVSHYMIQRLSSMVPLKNAHYCPHIVMDEYRLGTLNNVRSRPKVIFNVTWQHAPNMRRKMLPELIQAFALVRREILDAQLVLAGEPMNGQSILRRLAGDLGVMDGVRFLGKVAPDQKIEYMQQCGAYYQCSRHEGFGVAIAEAMACGAPVVVNRKTAIPEVVGPCGYYVANETPEEIADTLIHVLRNPDEARQVGIQAAQRIDDLFRFARRRDFFADLFAQQFGLRSKPSMARAA